MNAAFLPSPPLPARATPLSRCRHAPRCPLHRAAAATLSIPRNRGAFPPGGGAFVHTEKTKRKIGETVMRRAAARRARARHLMVSLQKEEDEDAEEVGKEVGEEEECVAEKADETEEEGRGEEGRKPRRRLSAESRAKISAALKGRRKSAAHREALRARFEGDRNPMYGRKLSKESRAKISAAMTGRSRRRRLQEAKPPSVVSEEAMVDLRDKAARSRLLTGPKSRPVWKRRQCKDRMLEEQAEAKEIEELLTRVSRLDKPPENVARRLETNRKMREEEGGGAAGGAAADGEQSVRCECCKASGFVKCPECVGAFGVASARCDVCFGAGAVFCKACQGVGEVAKGGVC